MKCIICGMKNSTSGRPCKLCGIRTKKQLKQKGFGFCCAGCAERFKLILDNSLSAEAAALLKKEIVI